jgi:hypothetical protein
MQANCVFCDMGTEFLNIVYVNFMIQGPKSILLIARLIATKVISPCA